MRHSSHWVRAAALGLLLGFATSVAPAAATPVSVYADGSTSYGFDADDVDAAIDAGATGPIVVSGLTGGTGWLDVTTPIGISGFNGTDASNPSEGDSIWTVHIDTDAPAELLEDFALVILGHDPNDPIASYQTGNVGLEIDTELPWLFVSPEGFEEFVYIAYLLGDVQAGQSYQIPIHYLVAQALVEGTNEQDETVFMFPRYTYAAVSGLNVPEPSTLALLLVGVGAAFVAGRAR